MNLLLFILFITNPKNYIKNVGISNDKYFRKNITVSSRFSSRNNWFVAG